MNIIDEMVGKTLVHHKQTDETLTFVFGDGSKYLFYHEQDCCESVWLEDVVGDIKDLYGNPLLVIEERTNDDDPPLYETDLDWNTYTWTFYELRTVKASVTLRWYGTSNGYYSERVDIRKLK